MVNKAKNMNANSVASKNRGVMDCNSKNVFILACFISFLMVFVFNYLTPYTSDDFAYNAQVLQAKNIGDLFAQEYIQYMTWNGRSVAHFLLRVSMLCPPIIFKILNSAVFVGLELLIYANVNTDVFAGINKASASDNEGSEGNKGSEGSVNINNKKKYDIRLFIGINVLMWLGCMVPSQTVFWQTGAFNYLWGSSIILGFATLYGKLAKECKNGIWLAPVMFILGVLAGWCNENTSGAGILMTLSYFLCYMFFKSNSRGNRTKGKAIHIGIDNLWMLTGIIGQIAGLLIMVLAPGNKVRAAFSDEEHTGLLALVSRFQKLTIVMKEEFFIYIAVFVVMIILLRAMGNSWERLGNSLFFFGLFIVTSYALVMAPPPQRRAFFGAGIFLFIAIADAYSLFEETQIIGALKTAVVAVALIYFVLDYMDAGANMIRIYRDSNQRQELIEQEIAKGNTQTIKVPMLNTDYDNRYTVCYECDVNEDPGYWINVSYETYYGVEELIGVPYNEWED